jgi:hypothetical protein
MPFEQVQHLCLGPKALFSIAESGLPKVIDTHAGSNCGQNIRQPSAPSDMHNRRGGRYGLNAEAESHIGQPLEPLPVLSVIMGSHQEIHVLPKAARQPTRRLRPSARAALRVLRFLGGMHE